MSVTTALESDMQPFAKLKRFELVSNTGLPQSPHLPDVAAPNQHPQQQQYSRHRGESHRLDIGQSPPLSPTSTSSADLSFEEYDEESLASLTCSTFSQSGGDSGSTTSSRNSCLKNPSHWSLRTTSTTDVQFGFEFVGVHPYILQGGGGRELNSARTTFAPSTDNLFENNVGMGLFGGGGVEGLGLGLEGSKHIEGVGVHESVGVGARSGGKELWEM
ncbi:hypothetical protein C8F04DRAFT_1194303 [Mycena alexandri]|uniref:Uncharacterized protein n=1 Tax=Mycena alexandri TaxID=1745969 RepID=A0AAD6SAG1_9AGAR|nr:hypothetical protein C8F04DRAFT_1194303 [Mycena alexandri]